jgi:hypothetical protein
MTSSAIPENSRLYHFYHSAFLKKHIYPLFPRWEDIKASLKLFGLILLGGILLLPLMSKLPVLGWDWYFFFNANHPIDNIYSHYSPFLPYTHYFIELLTWMNWRTSLAFLGGLTFAAIALGTWRNGGRYGSILLALLTPLPLFVMWVGHPDGLALIGLLTSFIPLALIKPQITFWAFLRSKATIFWLGVCLGATMLIWPYWLGVAFGNRWDHSAATGWQALGWPIIIIGLVFILGAGNDPWRLMAAGCFITPDLMPYHMVVLLPVLGRVKGWEKGIVWLAAWMVFLGLGLGGNFRFLNLLFPLSIYLSLQTRDEYKQSLLSHLKLLQGIYFRIKCHFTQSKPKETQGEIE